MIQPHNRHMLFSLYISALAVTDTMSLLKGKDLAEVYFRLQRSFCDKIKHEKQNHKTVNLHLLKLFISMRLEYSYFFTGFILYLNQVHKIALPPNWKIGNNIFCSNSVQHMVCSQHDV